jgi:hypothetical protein
MQELPPSLVDHTTLSKASVFTRPDSLHIHSAGYHADVLSPIRSIYERATNGL